jgi:acetyl-CoA carboxylase biotin carboxyl carrier protein
MTSDALVASVNGATPASTDQRLRTLRAEAARLVEEVSGPLKHIALRTGDCAVELTWADPPPVVVAPVAAPVEVTTVTGQPPASGGAKEATIPVVAPLVGVFFAAPAPGAKPFVQVGERVEANQRVGIIEAMKLMNHIVSDVAGIVTEVLVADGQPVEFGQELVRVRPETE